LAGDIKDFMADMEQKSGAQLFVMAGYLKPDGSIGEVSHTIQLKVYYTYLELEWIPLMTMLAV
jgi:hypothetical protein